MKKHWKKVVAFLTAAIMLAVMVPFLGLASAEETEPKVDQTSPLSVEVTTEKSKYTLLSIIGFNVRITNNSDTDIENIDVVAQLGQDLVFVKGSETTTSKDSLAPGEVYEWSYKAKVSRDRLKKADKLLVPLAFMRDIFIWDSINIDPELSEHSQESKASTRANLISAYSNEYLSDSTVRVFYDSNSVKFGYLHTNPTNCYAGDSSNVTFYIDIISDEEIENRNVELYFEDKLIGNLNDNGENGDEQPNDGLYSGTYTVFSNERKYSQYYVKYKNQKSDIKTLLFAKSWTKEEEEIINNFYLDIAKIKEKYAVTQEEYKNQEEETLLKAEQYYHELIAYLDSRSDITSYDFTGFNIMVMFDFAIPVGIPFDDLIENSNDNTEMQLRTINKSINSNYTKSTSPYKSKIITLQPHFSDLTTDVFDNAAENIVSEYPNYTFKENLDNSQITASTMKSLSKYGVIILDSHGGNWNSYGYIISLSEKVTLVQNDIYRDDITEGRIIPNGSCYVITEKFFNDYYSNDDFNNSIIYLGTCHGGDTDVSIRQILNSKGAEAVMTYKNTVITTYNQEMITSISEYLSKGDTVQEAVKKAKEKNGEHDPYISSETYNNLGFWDKLWYKLGFIESSNPAELILTGNNTSFTLSKNPGSELITGQVLDRTNNKPISSARVDCSELNINCITDKNGIFRFEATLPLKQATFVFSHDNYEKNVVTVAGNSYSMLNTITLAPKKSGNPNIPSTAVEFNGHYYQVYDTPMTWDEAKAYCESLGGHLATITSAEENNFIKDLVSSGTKNVYWLGASDAEQEGVWKWVTSEPFEFTNWSYGEPNDDGEISTPEDYLEMYKSSGKWNDGEIDGDPNGYGGKCSLANHGLICEWDTDVKPTGTCITQMEIVDHGQYTGNQGDSRVFHLDKSGLAGNDNRYYGNGNIGLDGTEYNNGLEVWIARWNFREEISWAYATYKLDGKYTRLTGKTSLIKSANTDNFDTTIYFYNGDTLLQSYTLTNEDYEKQIDVDVSGVNELKILVQDNKAVKRGTSFALYDMFLK